MKKNLWLFKVGPFCAGMYRPARNGERDGVYIMTPGWVLERIALAARTEVLWLRASYYVTRNRLRAAWMRALRGLFR